MSVRINTNAAGGVTTTQDTESTDLTGVVTATPTSVPVNPFDASSYNNNQDVPKTVTLSDGSSITLPTVDQEQLQSLFGNLTSEQQTALFTQGRDIANTILNATASGALTSGSGALSSSSGALSSGTGSGFGGSGKGGGLTSSSGALSSSSGALTSVPSDVVLAVTNGASNYQSATGSNYDSAIIGVSMMGLNGIQSDLSSLASSMQGNLNQQNTWRSQASELQQDLANWPSGQSTISFTYNQVNTDGTTQNVTANLTQAQAQSVVSTLQGQVANSSSTTQLQQLQLQNAYQNYQQVFQTISNIMSVENKTSMSIIQNIHS